jgi:hypothetical protein
LLRKEKKKITKSASQFIVCSTQIPRIRRVFVRGVFENANSIPLGFILHLEVLENPQILRVPCKVPLGLEIKTP